MKICMIGALNGLSSPVRGGPERAFKNIIRGAIKYDQENEYIFVPLGFQENVPLALNSHIRLYPTPIPIASTLIIGHPYWAQAKKHVIRVINRERPDVVLCHDPLFITFVPHDIRKRTILILHGPFWKGYSLLYPSLKFMNKLIYRRFVLNKLSWLNMKTLPLIICVAKCLQQELPSRLRVKSVVLENPVNEEFFNLSRKNWSLNSDGKYHIISVGGIKPLKNHETLILAVKEILNRGKLFRTKLKAKIIGSYEDSFNWYYRELVSLIQKYSLNDVIDIATDLEDNALRDEYINADICVHTGLIEGLPNAVQEAMAVGLPIIATRSGDIPLIIKHKYNGFLFSGCDYKKLASYIELLMNDPRLARSISKKARETAYLRWSLEGYITKLNQILKRFIN